MYADLWFVSFFEFVFCILILFLTTIDCFNCYSHSGCGSSFFLSFVHFEVSLALNFDWSCCAACRFLLHTHRFIMIRLIDFAIIMDWPVNGKYRRLFFFYFFVSVPWQCSCLIETGCFDSAPRFEGIADKLLEN